MEINETKTKYVIASTKNKWNNIYNIQFGTYQFERVEEFKYLGSLVTEDNRTSKEVNERIRAGNRYGALQYLMKSKDISNKRKIKIYRTIIRPVVTYTAETWCLLKNDENRIISIWERKI